VSATRRAKRFLTAEQKYDLWVRILTGQVTQSDAAAEEWVWIARRSPRCARWPETALSQRCRRRGRGQRKVSVQEASELAKLRVEVDRLGAVVIDQAVELAVLRGKSSWG
jgi:hypothetical protein